MELVLISIIMAFSLSLVSAGITDQPSFLFFMIDDIQFTEAWNNLIG